jgi:hypothetical protein
MGVCCSNDDSITDKLEIKPTKFSNSGLSYLDVVKNIKFLQQIIHTKDSSAFFYNNIENSINVYMDYMTSFQNTKNKVLPLDVEYIWYVHKLNPIAYKNDCENFSKKKLYYTTSINLKNAVDENFVFLEKFKKTQLFNFDTTNSKLIKKLNKKLIEDLINEYYKFIKVFNISKMSLEITPEIDLIWYTFMSHPLKYHTLCFELFQKILDRPNNTFNSNNQFSSVQLNMVPTYTYNFAAIKSLKNSNILRFDEYSENII